MPMKTVAKQNEAIPQHDYRRALQSAVNWLGERYVLAEPVKRLNDDRKAFFSTPREWYPQSGRA